MDFAQKIQEEITGLFREFSLIKFLILTSPVFLLIAALIGAGLLLDRKRRERLAKSGIDEIDKMDGIKFEDYLAMLFKKLGFKVVTTQNSGDYGGDIVIENDGVKTVVQAKRFKNNVGIEAVQQAVAAKGVYNCKRAMVVTNANFTKAARELAKANYVTLWGRKLLIEASILVKEEGEISEKFDPETLHYKR